MPALSAIHARGARSPPSSPRPTRIAPPVHRATAWGTRASLGFRDGNGSPPAPQAFTSGLDRAAEVPTNRPVLSGFRAVLAAATLITAVSSHAPFQCSSEPDPRRRRIEDPSEVLFDLAERFKASGDRDGRIATLRFLVERYPSSRFAGMARQDLESLGAPAPEPAPSE